MRITTCTGLFGGLLLGLAGTGAAQSIYPGDSNWVYQGCYNETTLLNGTNGARALNGGTEEALDTMTVPMCLAFCKSNSYAWAGLEYTRECYCAPYLSALAAKVSDSDCNLACKGNSSQWCGGSLKLTVYEQETNTKGAAVQVKDVKGKMGNMLALAVGVGVLVAFV